MASFGELDSFERAKAVLELIATVIVILGLPIAAYRFNCQRATRYLSDLAMNEDEMGYFVARYPHWLWCLWPLHIPTVPVPRVPSVGTIIKAGDDGLFTSAAFDGSKSTNPAVSWRPIYEAFFREYIWALDRSQETELWSQEWVSAITGGDMEKYKEEARFDVWKTKHKTANWVWAKHTRSRWWWPFSTLRQWCVRHIIYRVDIGWHHLWRSLWGWLLVYGNETISALFAGDAWVTVEVASGRMSHVDRHLLYYPWKIDHRSNELCFRKSSDGGSASGSPDCEKGAAPRFPRLLGPILVSSLKPLKVIHPCIVGTSLANTPPAKEEKNRPGQHLRIYNDAPAVQVSEEDLGALCFVLGIETRGPTFLPCGRGGLGHLLSTCEEGGMSATRLIYHDKERLACEKAAGSGYSTLLAKHLACGCLPFARRLPENLIETVPVTRRISNLIKEGVALCDTTPPPGTWDWQRDEFQFLNDMPGNGTVNYYSEPCNLIEGWAQQSDGFGLLIEVTLSNRRSRLGDSPESARPTRLGSEVSYEGLLYHIDAKSHSGFQVTTPAGTWWDAVASIAFGGLAPMTTQPLVEAVRFSVGGKPETAEDIHAFERLINYVISDFSTNTGHDGSLLFGKSATRTIQLVEAGVSVDFLSETLGADNNSIRDIVKQLAIYTTLLEALIAKVEDPQPSGSHRSPFQIGCQKRDEVFEACAKEIENTYIDAVKKREIKGGMAESLGGVLQSLMEEGKITAKQCGTVARCIIMAWTSQVKSIDWDHSRERDHEDAKKRLTTTKQIQSGEISSMVDKNERGQAEWERERKTYRPMALEELPDIALWK